MEKQIPTPYLDVKRVINDREGRREKLIDYLQIVTLICTVGMVIAVSGLIYIGLQTKFRPYIIETNSTGRITSSRILEESTIDSRFIRAELANWVTSYRSVISDKELQTIYIEKAYAYVSNQSPAKATMDKWYVSATPFERAKKYTVVVTIESQLRLSEKSFQVEWKESFTDKKGEPISSERYRGILTFEQHEVDADTIRDNALGIFITAIEIQKIGG